jgi:DNA invertase Pin-like site-specific DNA recombinase
VVLPLFDERPLELVSYIRVSTEMQEESGLGLEAQLIAIEQYRAANDAVVIKEFREIETGTRKRHRPEILRALDYAKRRGARLVIAKLDRLSRSVTFVSTLMDSKSDFVACDNPHATPLLIHILVAVAQDEAKTISARIKSALGAYKANGRVSRRIRELYPDGVPEEVRLAVAGKLGASLEQCRNLTPEARALGTANAARSRRAEAHADNARILPRMEFLRASGATLQAIADDLNAADLPARGGGVWTPTQVRRVLERAKLTRAEAVQSWG